MSRILRNVLALFCLGLVVLITVSTWERYDAASNPDRVLRFLPGSTVAKRFWLAKNLESGPRDQLEKVAIDLMHTSPLDDLPIIVAATTGMVGVDPAYAAALRKNPRNVPARLNLIQRAVLSGSCENALHELDRLIAIAPNYRKALVELGTEVTKTQGCFEALEKYLKSSSTWPRDVVRILNRSDVEPGLLFELNKIAPGDHSDYIDEVFRRRGVIEAFIAWVDLLPANDVSELAWPYDGKFQGRPGAPPFNWQFDETATDHLADGGLYVFYSGREAPRVVSQIMLLTSGPYRLTALMSGDVVAKGGGFKWAVRCLDSAIEIGSVTTRALDDTPREIVGAFNVPSGGCVSQTIYLQGAPGEFPVRARAVLHEIKIAPAPENKF